MRTNFFLELNVDTFVRKSNKSNPKMIAEFRYLSSKKKSEIKLIIEKDLFKKKQHLTVKCINAV